MTTQLPHGVAFGGSLVSHLNIPHLLYARGQAHYGMVITSEGIEGNWGSEAIAGFPLWSWRSTGTGEKMVGYTPFATTYRVYDVPSRDMLLVEAGAMLTPMRINDPSLPEDEDDIWGRETTEHVGWLMAGLRFQSHVGAQLKGGSELRDIRSYYAHVMFGSFGLPESDTAELFGDPIVERDLGFRIGMETSSHWLVGTPTILELSYTPTPGIVLFQLISRWDIVCVGDERPLLE
ncbi:MAG: hypothetical protein AAFX99_24475 [Myxococcota bacterium]